MSENTVHTSPDLFDENRTNVFDPNSTEMIGQIQHTPEGDIATSTRSMQLSMFDNVSEGYGFLKGVKRKRAKKNEINPWDARMKQYHKNHNF